VRTPPPVVLALSCLAVSTLRAQVPDACKVLPVEAVTSTVGPGYARDPSGNIVTGDDYSTCLYTKGPGTLVGITILEAPEGAGKAVVTMRQEMASKGGREVSPLAGVCDTAFAVTLPDGRVAVMAGRAGWQLDVEASAAGKPDKEAAAKVAKAACANLK
jgi:hypothetical protein